MWTTTASRRHLSQFCVCVSHFCVIVVQTRTRTTRHSQRVSIQPLESIWFGLWSSRLQPSPSTYTQIILRSLGWIVCIDLAEFLLVVHLAVSLKVKRSARGVVRTWRATTTGVQKTISGIDLYATQLRLGRLIRKFTFTPSLWHSAVPGASISSHSGKFSGSICAPNGQSSAAFTTRKVQQLIYITGCL